MTRFCSSLSPLSKTQKFATLSSNSDRACLPIKEVSLSGKSEILSLTIRDSEGTPLDHPPPPPGRERLRLREVGWSWPYRLSWSRRPYLSLSLSLSWGLFLRICRLLQSISLRLSLSGCSFKPSLRARRSLLSKFPLWHSSRHRRGEGVIICLLPSITGFKQKSEIGDLPGQSRKALPQKKYPLQYHS